MAANRWVRRIAYWGVVSVAVVLLSLWVVSGPVLGISHVTVTGYTGAETARVQATAELVAGTGTMVRVPTGDMRRALTRFPGVLDTAIERDWPRSITVRVVMGDPVAVLAVNAGGRYLLSPSGQVMGAAGTTGGLPVLRVAALPANGVLTDPTQRGALLFIGWLPPEIAGRLRNLHAEGGGLKGTLYNGLELRIGAPTGLAQKAQALVAVLSQADPTALTAAAYLDISRPRWPMLGSRIITIIPVDGGTTTDGTATDGSSDGGDDHTGTTGDTGVTDATG